MTTRRGGQGKSNLNQYDHRDKERLNNPPAGLVTPKTDSSTGCIKQYSYDPLLDPQLARVGQAGHTPLEPHTIIEAARRRNRHRSAHHLSFFEMPQLNRLVGKPSLVVRATWLWQ